MMHTQILPRAPARTALPRCSRAPGVRRTSVSRGVVVATPAADSRATPRTHVSQLCSVSAHLLLLATPLAARHAPCAMPRPPTPASSPSRRSRRAAASAAAGALPPCARFLPPPTATLSALPRRLLVPVFIVVAGVAPSHATPLSVCAIAGGAVTTFIAHSQRRRADGAPLIDYGCARTLAEAQRARRARH